MKLDQLPNEVLCNIFSELSDGGDLLSLRQTNRTLYEVSQYESLWRPYCVKIREKIQGQNLSGGASRGDYRKFYSEQVGLNQHIADLLDRLSYSDNREAKEAALNDIWSHGVRARDVLLDVATQSECSVKAAKAHDLLQMLKQKEAVRKMKDIAANPNAYDASDFLTTFDSFYAKHVLNPSKESVFGDIINEVRTSDDIKFCRSPRQIQKTATVLAEVLFDDSRLKGYDRKTAPHTKTSASSYLSSVLEDGTTGIDTVNVGIYSHIGAMYGLRISPVMMAQNGKFIDCNFARVDDPSKEEGYFIINVLSRVVLSGLDMAEMLEQQRSIRVVSMNSPPSLQVLAASTALQRSRPAAYSTPQEYIGALYASVVAVHLLCQGMNNFADYFERVQTAAQPKDGSAALRIDHDTLRNELANDSLPNLYKQLLC